MESHPPPPPPDAELGPLESEPKAKVARRASPDPEPKTPPETARAVARWTEAVKEISSGPMLEQPAPQQSVVQPAVQRSIVKADLTPMRTIDAPTIPMLPAPLKLGYSAAEFEEHKRLVQQVHSQNRIML